MKANLDNERFFLELVAAGSLRVTRLGKVYRADGQEVCPEKPGTDAYRYFTRRIKGTTKVKGILVHRLVWALYKGLLEDNDIQVNHKDGNKQNCRLSNLELATGQQNTQHAHDIGLATHPVFFGENHPASVFSDADVKRYRRLYAKGLMSSKEIQKATGASQPTVSRMLSGKTYSHV